MERLGEATRTGVVLLDAGVVRDVASALSGLWTPADEPDPERRDQLVAAARVRIYADRDQRGWHLVTTPTAHGLVERRDDAEWSVDFVQDVATLPDAPAEAEVAALASIYHESGIDGESGNCLAYAVLHEPVIYVISRNPRAFKHSREHDLPERLEILDPVEAVERLRIAPGEEPLVGPPADGMLARGEHWWVP